MQARSIEPLHRLERALTISYLGTRPKSVPLENVAELHARYLRRLSRTTTAAIKSPATAYGVSNPGSPVPVLLWLEVATVLAFSLFDKEDEVVAVTALAGMM